jgi:subtilisin-like proprotein convertase family protein
VGANTYEFEGVLPQDILDYGQPADPEWSTDNWFYLRVDDTGTIADLDVKLNIDHDDGSDLEVVLYSPADPYNGVTLARDGDQDNLNWMDGKDTIFDDDDVPPNASEVYRKPVAGRLSDFTGQSVNGEWALRITDHWPDDVGKLWSWSLFVELQ